MNVSTQIQNIGFQLKSLEIQFNNINLQIQNMGMQNLGTQILNTGIQMINMGIQMLNIGKDLPINGFEIPNLSQQIQNMGTQIQNIGMNINNQVNMNFQNQGMMQMMQMQMMMNMMNNSVENDSYKWNLIFEEDKNRYKIPISPSKRFQDAMNLYKIKTNKNKIDDLKFIFNGIIINKDVIIDQSGLSDNAVVTVFNPKNIMGG